MIRTALVILFLELIVIGWVRWRQAARARGEVGRLRPESAAAGPH
jgi:hypothetical protein